MCQGTKFTILFTHHGNLKMGRCQACGLVQVVPMLSASQIAGLYHEDFDHFAPYIAQLTVHHAYFKQKIEEIKEKIEGRRSKTDKNRHLSSIVHHPFSLLDIGCLTGVLLEEAKKVGWKPEGIDLSRDAVTYCRKHHLTAFYGTVYTVKELREKSYNVITAFQIVEHERDPLTMMKRIHSLLKDNGMVILATPNYGGFWRKVMGKRWFGFAHPEHVVLLDFNSMRTLLEKAGFHDIQILADTPRPFPLSFAFTRGADYFPWAAFVLKSLGKLFDHFDIKNPINPWDDMIAYGRK